MDGKIRQNTLRGTPDSECAILRGRWWTNLMGLRRHNFEEL